MKQTKTMFSFALVLVSLLALTQPAVAQECTTQYGGEVSCPPTDLTINKQVAQPVVDSKGGVQTSSGVFYENLSTATPFVAGQEVVYRLIVKNTGAVTLTTVTVKDVLPSYLTFESGPGTYDAATRTLTIVLENLAAGESRTVDFVAQAVSATQFPAGQNVFCVTNYAEARADLPAQAGSRFDSDTAQVCLQAAPTLPVAGYNDLLLLLPFAGVGLSGLALLKKRT